MRGEVCIGVASLLSFVATILLIFAHIGQTNHNSVARGISLVSVNVSGFGLALQTATGDASPGFYNNTPYAPLGQGLGVRQIYEWGFYGHCAYVNKSMGLGLCTAEGNGTFGYAFAPLDVLLSDIPSGDKTYRQTSQLLIPPSTFKDSTYERTTSRAGFYLIFIGSISTALAFITGLIRHNATFSIALFLSLFGSLMTMIGAAIWSALIHKTQSINKYEVYSVDLGIDVSFGIALWLIWAAFIAMLLSTIPYFLSCYTYRKRFV